MGQRIVQENASVATVSYALPNKHYIRELVLSREGRVVFRTIWADPRIAVNLSFIGLDNTAPSDAEVRLYLNHRASV